MQWLAEICVRRPVFALMFVMAMVVAGGVAFTQLGVDRFPKLDLPTIYVRTSYPGASPEEVESEVSRIIEDAVATVAGIDELRSISREGSSFVLITFGIASDIDVGSQDVRDAVSSVLNRLPRGIDPPVIFKSDTDSTPVMTLVVSGPRDPKELYVWSERAVKNVIESAPGVGEALIVGASDRAVQVKVEANRLAAHGLSILQVRDALQRQNAEVPGGRVDAGFRELGLRTLGRVGAAREFADLVVTTRDGMPIRIRDLGEVVDGTKEVRSLSRLDGESAVILDVQRRSGANTVAVIEEVKQRLGRCAELLPDDLKVTVIRDQSRYIHASLHEVQKHLFSGSILASLVVLVFMRSWRSTLIAGVAIPGSIIASFAVMRALGFTLNNVTMLALVLMVGVVIDDAIVVLENIYRCMEEKGMSPFTAAIEGTREIGLAVLATTISLVIVFLPVSFLSSVTGRMLYEFGMTATVAILVSMLISFSLTPMMCSQLLRNVSAATGHEQAASRRGFYQWIDWSYDLCLRWSMRHRGIVGILCILVVLSIIPLFKMVRQDYIPTNVDESEFEVGVTAPEGATVLAMDQTLHAVEAGMNTLPGIEHMLTTVGGRGFGSVNSGFIYVRMKDIGERTFSMERLFRSLLAGDPGAAFRGNVSQQELMTKVRGVLKPFKDLRVSVRNQTSLRQGAPVDIDYTISGPDLQKLSKFADAVRDKIRTIPGIADPTTTYQVERPELLVRIDRERAAALGVDVTEIAETLRVSVGGDDRVSRYRDATVDDVYDVELRLVGIDRSSPEAIAQLYVRVRPSRTNADITRGRAGNGGGGLLGNMAGGAGGGLEGGGDTTSGSGAGSGGTGDAGVALTRLDNVVIFREQISGARIDRLDRQRMVAVRANVAPGFALGECVEALDKAAHDLGLPPGCTTSIRGRGRELERTIADLGLVIALSFVFMYIVLAAQFEHLLHPVTILVSLPLAVPFGLLSLYLGGETLNLYSMLGVLVLFGVVKKASILQVDRTNALRRQGMDRLEAILQANRDRLRPILMTTIAFVAGMLPLLLGAGPGAEERRSIAVVAVGGQTLSLLLTLVAVPVVYSWLDDLGLWLRARLGGFHRGTSKRDEPVSGAVTGANPAIVSGVTSSVVETP